MTPLARADADSLRLIIRKADRRLEIWRGETRLHMFRVGLGHAPVGDKVRAGDGRTPEGTFYVCVKNPRSRFHRSLGLSYPDPDDAARGLRAGLISEEQHASIVAAHRARRRPPWDTELGGEIFIHGHGAGSDWTRGCIALDDADMQFLFDLLPTGTVVTITP